ncbi:transporter [Seminavis robusta]|uniref:Transporter n=1 Tax=Seminavis robusta TaxID=568900 RepID=A0A9N8D503_9STRA|nr:transporter [Seminavis robusta]|eukprot:Sro6_g004890.1 transporter (559) ;mRNA; f:42150-43826
MREIPKLQVLCLRAVGSQSCSAEETFAVHQETNEPSRASKLLRSFHQRPVIDDDNNDNDNDDEEEKTLRNVPMSRSVCVGKGSSRRAQANDVDLNHPLIAHHAINTTGTSGDNGNNGDNDKQEVVLIMEHGNPALDCLQSYIDSLVELGRMDDNRMGIHFFEEWRNNVLVGAGKPLPAASSNSNNKPEGDEKNSSQEPEEPPRKRTRRRGSDSDHNNNSTLRLRVKKQGPPPPLGSISLNNCAIGQETLEAMRDSGMGVHIGVLDLTGIYNLNDTMLEQLLPHCPNIQRLSFKNCRRVTCNSLQILAQYQTKLKFLDIGGVYNITPDEVIETIVVGNNSNSNNNNKKKNKKNTIPCPDLIELHVSGLGWNDHLLKMVVSCSGEYDDDEDDYDDVDHNNQQQRPWKALSFGFSMNLTSLVLRQSLSKVSSSLISLALHFCEYVVDNALMGMLGRNLPHVKYLDVRGNPSLNSMTGWFDGRASADFNRVGDENARHEGSHPEEASDEEGNAANVQELTVLARFTGITKASLEDTLRIHPVQAAKLKCFLDGSGIGVGIYR